MTSRLISDAPRSSRFAAALAAMLVACMALSCPTYAGELSTPIKVEIVQTEDGYRLLRGGEPYYIKGAGREFASIASLAAHGGNSIRNWTTVNDVETAQEVLDEAHAHGVTVALCLPMASEHWGFDYDDPEAVSEQFERFRGEVLKYRDHPALLAWIIGNELNYDYKNPKVYDAVNDISKMIHELDPNHPTTTTVAGLFPEVLDVIMERAPDLDFVSFQAYGQIFGLPEFIEKTGHDKPIFITEWGAIGWWEVGKTQWGAPIEATSTEKARTYLKAYREKIEPLEHQVIGSYVFLWGQKQERTPTWFGLFTEEGEETEAVDVMHYIWNGEWPDNRSPRVHSMKLHGQQAADSVTLTQGKTYVARIRVVDPDGDKLTYRWELKPESTTTQVGGAFEESIANLDGLIEADSATARVTAPKPGAYRLFVYAYDGQDNAAHANIPFLVKP